MISSFQVRFGSTGEVKLATTYSKQRTKSKDGPEGNLERCAEGMKKKQTAVFDDVRPKTVEPVSWIAHLTSGAKRSAS